MVLLAAGRWVCDGISVEMSVTVSVPGLSPMVYGERPGP
jgi:hypothetical protein